jgi:hypothetical protein
VGALNSSGQVAVYTSETPLNQEHAVVKGNHIRIYEQDSGKIRHDYGGDGVYDEDLPLAYNPYNTDQQESLSNLDTLKLADKKVVQDLQARLTGLAADNSYPIQPVGVDFEGYVFKKKDLELIKKDIELIRQKNNNNLIMSEFLIREINTAQKRFSGDIGSFIRNNPVYPLYSFNQILVNPDNGKLQFIYKSPIEGTSFAAPQIAVEKATVPSN